MDTDKLSEYLSIYENIVFELIMLDQQIENAQARAEME